MDGKSLAALHRPSHEMSDAGSRSAGALLRAGPCPKHEDLQHISKLWELRGDFKTCASQDDVKSVFEKAKVWKSSYALLTSACKTALNDLKGAQSAKRKAEEKALEKGGKKAKKDGTDRRPSVRKCQSWWSMLESAKTKPISRHKLPGAVPDGSEPFIIEEQTWLGELVATSECLKVEVPDFTSHFSKSTRRVTEGRGQRQVLDAGVVAHIMPGLMKRLTSKLVWIKAEDCAESENLQKLCTLTCFGMASGTESPPMAEKSMMPSLRLSLQGTRLVRMASLPAVVGFLAKQAKSSRGIDAVVVAAEWLGKARPSEIEAFLTAGNKVWEGRVGPHDLLFAPPMFMVGHQVLPGQDHIGIRALVSPGADTLSAILKEAAKTTVASKDLLDLGTLVTALDKDVALAAVEGRGLPQHVSAEDEAEEGADGEGRGSPQHVSAEDEAADKGDTDKEPGTPKD